VLSTSFSAALQPTSPAVPAAALTSIHSRIFQLCRVCSLPPPTATRQQAFVPGRKTALACTFRETGIPTIHVFRPFRRSTFASNSLRTRFPTRFSINTPLSITDPPFISLQPLIRLLYSLYTIPLPSNTPSYHHGC